MKTGAITMKNMSIHIGVVCAAALLVGVTSCRKKLCYDHDAHGYSVKVEHICKFLRADGTTRPGNHSFQLTPAGGLKLTRKIKKIEKKEFFYDTSG